MLFGLVLLCLIWSGLYYKVQSEKQIVQETTQKELSNYTRTFAEHTTRTIRGLDEMALFLKNQAENEGLSIDLPRLIKERRFDGQPFLVLGILNEFGALVASSEVPFVSAQGGDREFFQVHTGIDSGKLFIGKPTTGRASGKISIQATRRINKADGSFGGVVVIGVDPHYFTDFYKQVDLGEQSNISLIGRDGILRVRQSGSKVSMGLDFSTHVANEFSRGDSGYYTEAGIVDGVERFFSYRALTDYPLIVAVGVAKDYALKEVNQRIQLYYKACGAVSLVIVLFTALLLFGVERRRQAENTLKESEARIRSITHSSQDAILMMDPDGLISYWNPAATKMLGYTKEEAVGKELHRLLVPERYYDAYRKNFAEFRQTGTGHVVDKVSELAALHKTGHEIAVELSLSAIRIREDWHAVGILRDITERKQAEREMAQLFSILELRVASRTAELSAANAELRSINRQMLLLNEQFKVAKESAEAANRAKSAFLSSVSHELRTPMHAILGMAYIVQQADLSPDQRESLQKIQGAGQALLGLINDILDFAKAEDHKLDLKETVFSLNALLHQISAEMSPKAAKKALNFSINMADVPALLRGDAERLRQVLLHLVDNAIKYTPRGEVSVSVEPVEGSSSRIVLRFLIKDTGVGISAEQKQQLFQPFVQGDAALSRRYGGTGIGLALSRQLIRIMGGEIEVESSLGKGSTFGFTAQFGLESEAKNENEMNGEQDREIAKEADSPFPAPIAHNESGECHDKETAGRQLSRLRECLKNYDSEAVDLFRDVRRSKLLNALPQELEQLASLINDYEFDKAGTLLDRILGEADTGI